MSPGGPAATGRPPYRVLQVINSLAVGGAETYVVRLANRLDRSKFQVWIACGHPLTVGKELRPDVPVVSLGRGPVRLARPLHWRHIFTLYRLIRTLNADVVHTHLNAASYFAQVAARMAGRPVVHHNTGPLDYAPITERLKARVPPLAALMNLFVDRFVANTEMNVHGLLQRHIPLEKVRVIPYGVDLAEYRPCPDQRRKVRAELDLPQDVRIVGMVARLAAAKRVEYGISLLEGLVEHAAEAHLAIVGDGALHSKLAAQAERLGLSNRVHFLGVRHDVPRVMQAFDVYLQATMGSTVGSTTLEALASGVPVVFAVHDGDEAAIPRITLKEGETGFVVTMDNPAVAAARVAALLADPARLAHMRLQARALAEERFDLSASVRAVEAIYEELASRRPPRR